MKHERVGHETGDVNVRPIGWIVLVFIVSAAFIHIGVWSMFQYYRDREQRRDVRSSMIEQSGVPPEPRLQINPEHDWKEFYASQQKVLDSYDWVSREQGTVRIPIDRAMELLVERNTAK